MIAPPDPDFHELVAKQREVLDLLARSARCSLVVVDPEGGVVLRLGQAEAGEAAERSLRIDAESIGVVRAQGLTAKATAELGVALLRASYRSAVFADMYHLTISATYADLAGRNEQLVKLTSSLEQQVTDRTRELADAQAHAAREEKVAAIGRLASGVAHELNTPLGCLRSNMHALTEMINEGDLDLEEMREIAKDCVAMSDSAAKIVGALRGFAHIDSLGPSEIELHLEVAKTLAHLSLPEGVRVEQDLRPIPSLYALGGQVNLALLNLLENARDAVAEAGTIRVTTLTEADDAVITIEDSGPGIRPEDFDRVFDPFFTTKEVGRGVGLGLTVARDVILAHKGTLTLTSASERGTLARVTLPLDRARAA